MVCYWRALEHTLPPDQRILNDPYARGFLGPVRGGLVVLEDLGLDELVSRYVKRDPGWLEAAPSLRLVVSEPNPIDVKTYK